MLTQSDGYGVGDGALERASGLSRFLRSVFLQMAASVALSGGAAALVAFSPALQAALMTETGFTLLGWIVLLAPLGLVIALGAGVETLSTGAARSMLLGYAVLVGLSLGTLFTGFEMGSIVVTFLVAACAFAALAVFGMTTGRSLSGLGSLLFIALIGLIIAMLVNLFVRSASLDLGLSAIGILIFAGLTAFDMQRLKRIYLERGLSPESAAASVGALTLYLDLLNIFVSLLRFTGRRR